MRVTLDLEDDVHAAVKDLARYRHETMGQVLSELAREALARRAPLEEVSVSPTNDGGFFGFQPLPNRGMVVTNELIDQLRLENDT